MVLERTKQILKNHEGHEYCGNGVSYHVFLYPIDAGTNPEEAIRTFLLSEIYDDDKEVCSRKYPVLPMLVPQKTNNESKSEEQQGEPVKA